MRIIMLRGKEEEEKVVAITFGYVVYYFIITLPYCGKAFAWLLLGWGFCLFLAGGDVSLVTLHLFR